MRNLKLFLTSLLVGLLVCGNAWGAIATAEIKASTTLPSLGAPEYQFYIVGTSNSSYYWKGDTKWTKNTNERGKFAFYKAPVDNAYYIYSVSEGKWVTVAQANTNTDMKGAVEMADDYDANSYWLVESGTQSSMAGYGFKIRRYTVPGSGVPTFDFQKYANFYGGFDNNTDKTIGLYSNGPSSDAGSCWSLVPVEETDYDMMLSRKIVEAKAEYEKRSGYTSSTGLITATSQFVNDWGDKDEGTDAKLSYLIDGTSDTNASHIWHSDWHNQSTTGINGKQYLGVNISAQTKVKLTIQRRNSSGDHPVRFSVYGTNAETITAKDKTGWTRLAVLDIALGTKASVQTSEIFDVKNYQKLRFYCDDTNCIDAGNGVHRGYFSLAEFQLNPQSLTNDCWNALNPEKANALLSAISTAEKVESATQEDVNTLTNAILQYNGVSFTVRITGDATAVADGGAKYLTQTAKNSETILAPAEVKSTDLTAITISGYLSKIEVNNNNKTINVTYYKVTETRPIYVSSNDSRTDNQRAEMLVDDNGGNPTNTKWGTTWNGSALYIVVRADATILKGYDLYNGNDTKTNQGRRWKTWKIEGSKDNSTWETIEAEADHDMPNVENKEKNSYYLYDNKEVYSYYKITITKNYTTSQNDMIQMSDLKFFVQEASSYTVKYKITKGGNEVWSETHHVESGDPYPAPTSPSAYIILSGYPTEGTVTENKEIELTYSHNYPFTLSSSYADVTWYTMTLHSTDKYYLYNPGDEATYMELNRQYSNFSENDKWCFMGDYFDGIKIYNKGKGDGYVLSASTTMAGKTGNNTFPLLVEETTITDETTQNKSWDVIQNTSVTNGFFLAQHSPSGSDFSSHKLNRRGANETTTNVLTFWTGGADDGSTFLANVYAEQEYTITATDQHDKTVPDGGVKFNGANYTSTLTTGVGLLPAALSHIEVSGYVANDITISGTTITVKYIAWTPETDPFAGKVFRLNVPNRGENAAAYEKTNHDLAWAASSQSDKSDLWKIELVNNERKYTLRNVKTGRYMYYYTTNYTHWQGAIDFDDTDKHYTTLYIHEIPGSDPVVYGISYKAKFAFNSSENFMHADGSNNIVKWGIEESKKNGPSSWTINEVSVSEYKTSEEWDLHWAYCDVVNQNEVADAITFGTNPGTYVKPEGWEVAKDAAQAICDAGEAGHGKTKEQLLSIASALKEKIAAVATLNMPIAGHFYTIAAAGQPSYYMRSTASSVSDKTDRLACSTDEVTQHNNVFYYNDDKLQGYTEGKYVSKLDDSYNAGPGETGAAMSFEHKAGTTSFYLKIENTRYLFTNNNAGYISSAEGKTGGDNMTWELVDVTNNIYNVSFNSVTPSTGSVTYGDRTVAKKANENYPWIYSESDIDNDDLTCGEISNYRGTAISDNSAKTIQVIYEIYYNNGYCYLQSLSGNYLANNNGTLEEVAGNQVTSSSYFHLNGQTFKSQGQTVNDFTIISSNMIQYDQNNYSVIPATAYIYTLNSVDKQHYYGTLCVPFNYQLADDVDAYTASVSGSVVTLTKYSSADDRIVPAGLPVLLYHKEDAATLLSTCTRKITFITGDDCEYVSEVETGSGFLGSFLQKTTAGEYVLGKANSKVGFYPMAEGGTIKANSAFISSKSEIKGFDITFDDDPTTIYELVDGQLVDKNAPIYNLGGQKLNKLQKGINIVNGRKVLY